MSWRESTGSAKAASLPVAPASATGRPVAPTFTKDVAPILFGNCVSCHRPGEVAPFALTTYDQVRRHGHEIVSQTHDRVMPPWKAAPNFGDFAGERRLSDEQIKTLRDWVDAGKPEGDAADLPPLRKFPEGWQLGEPDLIVKVQKPFTVPAEGRDVYRCFVLPLNLAEDKFVTAVEFRPSNRKVVHHALFFLDNRGAGRRMEETNQDGQPGYAHSGGPGFAPSGGLGGWAPGYTPRALPDGVGRPVHAGADLVVQVHFHPSGKPEQEQSTIGLYFAKKPPSKVLVSFPKLDHKIDIAAGETNYRIHDSFKVPDHVTLAGIIPHAHLLCQEIKAVATLPDGTTQPLIWIPRWDWDWQEQYLYKQPLKIPAGTRVDIDYRYDNSAANPKNPNNPPKRVTWGEQTGDEMAIVFFQLEIDRSAQPGMLARFLKRRLQRAATPPSQ